MNVMQLAKRKIQHNTQIQRSGYILVIFCVNLVKSIMSCYSTCNFLFFNPFCTYIYKKKHNLDQDRLFMLCKRQRGTLSWLIASEWCGLMYGYGQLVCLSSPTSATAGLTPVILQTSAPPYSHLLYL